MFLHLSVSHSGHRGVSASVHAGIHTPPGQTPPWEDTPRADTPSPSACWDTNTPLPSACWDTHPPCSVHAGIDMATGADGTHPTGMHSCLSMSFLA